MGQLVTPRVFLVGETGILTQGLLDYLRYTGKQEFMHEVTSAKEVGLTDGEIITSLFAKVCYDSHIADGRNKNITRINDIENNLIGTFKQGHLSVWEHATLNFIATDVSRILTHELVRHRTGTAYSQTSGRYVRTDRVSLVFDPILEPVRHDITYVLNAIEDSYKLIEEKLGLDQENDQTRKKQLTSALRRILPNGQSNEIAFSVNLRAIRHIVQVRTSRHAEWEIRAVFSEVYNILKSKYPLLFYGAREEEINGALEVSGMKMQPYDKVDE